MTRIWNEAGFQDDDPWVIETDEVKAGNNQKPLLPIASFIEKAEAGEGGLGVLIQPADNVKALAPHLDKIALVAVNFPAFNDGRAFSHSSLLRARMGYRGELRAVGDVLIDQIPLMLRVGITSLAVTNAVAIRRLEEGRLPGIANHYQPTARKAEDPKSYSWRRVS
jgi:uncharacterized protein (DUF934 family)